MPKNNQCCIVESQPLRCSCKCDYSAPRDPRPINNRPKADIQQAQTEAPTADHRQPQPLSYSLLHLSPRKPLGVSHIPASTMISRAAAPSSSSLTNLSSRSVRAQGAAVRSFATVQENAPPVHRHGGLKDQDRIFTNLYGHHGADLKSAMKYGDWYRTKDIVLKGHDWVSKSLCPTVHSKTLGVILGH